MHELQPGSQEFTVDFKSSDRQFDWLEISLLYDKSDKHLTTYDSYNAECSAKMIELSKIELSNILDAYSATNMMKFDISIDTQKHLLWRQYVVWHCNGYINAPISDYINNPVFQELLLESDYFGSRSDEKIYIDLWDSLGYREEIEKPSRNDSKLNVTIELWKSIAKKIRLRVWGYTKDKNLHLSTDGSLTLKYKSRLTMHLMHEKKLILNVKLGI